ncbi:unnamed protein product [Toxocara canis]|uniref:Secreted protein n=1 Tax=Toxocara canis TaxID=6265 RepID=A0A183U415_TOXCA|nr:unnamed protein product [Toxocara canis]VDM31769.1 unnamed protein product [Toxocara canis]
MVTAQDTVVGTVDSTLDMVATVATVATAVIRMGTLTPLEINMEGSLSVASVTANSMKFSYYGILNLLTAVFRCVHIEKNCKYLSP